MSQPIVSVSPSPELHHELVRPHAIITVVPDASAFQGWRAAATDDLKSLPEQLMGKGDTFVVDFGAHVVGQLVLNLTCHPAADAPTRLKLIFGEVPAEVAEPFDPYTGQLSRAWLQDEIINVDVLPQTITLPRRYAFRYLKIEIIDTAPAYKIRFSDIACRTITSADVEEAKPLPPSVPADLRAIDDVALRTLRNCMQEVFEDGPKRDRRLWMGDLRLQALASYVSYRNLALVRRCLELFAAYPREDGLVNADMYTTPSPHRGNCAILDYSALFAPAVLDYLQESGDRETAMRLWPTALRQLELLQYVDDTGLFVDPGDWWIFIDWSAPLHKSASAHGVLLYGLQATLELGQKLNREADVATLPDKIARMKQAAMKYLYDETSSMFVSGPDRQVSWASQAWMVLGGVVSGEQAAAVLTRVMADRRAIKPAGPYLYHHVVHAMFLCGMKQAATDLIRSYWGAMVNRGATTFWEVFDPNNDKLSPYNNHLMNSYCHAWSCTPTWFIRRWL